MAIKEEKNDKINEDQIKLIEAAQKRVKQKKFLFFHFSLMIFGNISFIIIKFIRKIFLSFDRIFRDTINANI